MSDEINVNGNCHCGKIEIKAVIKKVRSVLVIAQTAKQ